ncbi:toll-like receptor Tollo [Acanthaster planci]|uniref:Toll-like receptor Tollo n=1 Tax=Acanthaster planci TaxID=133434 RepID=A0A8B7ZY66_ACAPL|nr:toll-like receptor Tollo [Acanthaster planci]XP_022109695.1 toll-like receptor Tollo [Acanthaster planci]XP_022109696.1 toll-like receptor Tollo [Acanthaster planci]
MRPSLRMRREALLLFTVIHLTMAVGFLPYRCPNYCHCERRTKTVSCVRNLFTAVPLDLPRDTKTLELHRQNFTYMGRLSPVPISSLRKLNLTENSIQYMVDDALVNVPRLKRLDLSSNHLTGIPTAVSGASSLKELIVHNNHLRSLHVHDFANLTQLEVLDLGSNSLSFLPNGVFSKLHELAILYLSDNSIQTLSGEIFGNLSKLEELHLTHNQIQMVSMGWLSSVPNTWVLELGSMLEQGHPTAAANLLTATGTDFFLPNLERLVVSGNDLLDIPCEDFLLFPFLKYLDLSLNSITAIPEACFSMLGELGILKLNNNRIAALRRGAFFNSYSILDLDLSVNQIRELPPGTFIGTYLRTLDLSNNRIRRLNNGSFVGLEHLWDLFLMKNRIDRLTRAILRPLESLDILDLRMNRLIRVSNQFCNMSSLSNLALSGNLIEYISPGAFRGSNNLKGIFLNDNRIRTVMEETFDLPNLVAVKLDDNPWHCDCQMRWIREAMFPDSKRHTWMQYTDAMGVTSYTGITCSSPPSFANFSVFMIKESDIFRLICTNYVSPLAIEIIVGISFAIIALSTLCYVVKLYCKVRDLERTGAETSKCLS